MDGLKRASQEYSFITRTATFLGGWKEVFAIFSGAALKNIDEDNSKGIPRLCHKARAAPLFIQSVRLSRRRRLEAMLSASRNNATKHWVGVFSRRLLHSQDGLMLQAHQHQRRRQQTFHFVHVPLRKFSRELWPRERKSSARWAQQIVFLRCFMSQAKWCSSI